MQIKDKLQIFIVTYNRLEHLRKTLDQLLDINSPVRDFDITILNNCSTDGTDEYLQEQCIKYSNLKTIKNRYNVGAAANLIKPFELAEKEYIWVLCDDDFYNWQAWNEVEDAINNDEDIICVSNFTFQSQEEMKQIPNIVLQLSFTPAGIYKTKFMDDTTMRNMYETTYILFPYMCILFNYLNKGYRNIKVCSQAIVKNGAVERETPIDISYTRGSDLQQLSSRSKNMSWSVGYLNICQLIQDKNLREASIAAGNKFDHKSLIDLFKENVRKVYHLNFSYIRDLGDISYGIIDKKCKSVILIYIYIYPAIYCLSLIIFKIKILTLKIKLFLIPSKTSHYNNKITKLKTKFYKEHFICK